MGYSVGSCAPSVNASQIPAIHSRAIPIPSTRKLIIRFRPTNSLAPYLGIRLRTIIQSFNRAGHVASKMRYQSAQLVAYLTGGLWLRLAQRANDAMAQLSAGLAALDVALLAEPQANILFARVGERAATGLAEAGLLFYDMGNGVVRFVTSFQTTDDEVQEVLRRVQVALG